MINKLMKTVASMCILFLHLSFYSTVLANSNSGGAIAGGGGDPCEDKIKIIRDDIKKWILNNGPKGLSLGKMTVENYALGMLAEIEKTKIKCVGPENKGYPVLVNNFPKTCRFDKSDGKSIITCEIAKFNETNPSDQYVLVHHEYAGLAGLENPNLEDSNYDISNQISNYTEEQIVTKLSINPVKKNQKQETHEVFVSYKFATTFCQDMSDEAMKKAYSYCAENGFRKDECNITSVGEYNSETIHEDSGDDYSNGGESIYYKKLCTYQAKFQMVHKTLEKYAVSLDGEYGWFGNFIGIVTQFGLNTKGLANFTFKNVPDAANNGSQLDFRMTVSPSAVGTTLDLGTICISQFDADHLPNGAPLSNDNFSLVITHAAKHKYFDGCDSGEVPSKAQLKILK